MDGDFNLSNGFRFNSRVGVGEHQTDEELIRWENVDTITLYIEGGYVETGRPIVSSYGGSPRTFRFEELEPRFQQFLKQEAAFPGDNSAFSFSTSVASAI